MTFDLLTVSFFAQAAEPGLVTYFSQSNLAGKLIVIILGVFSLVAWTLMISKYLELSRLQQLNYAFEDRITQMPLLFDPQNPAKVNEAIPYSFLYGEAVSAFFRAGREEDRGQDPAEFRKMRMGRVENALQRGVSRKCTDYESKMVFLASIVSGAPFLGLLGTVWGVMDAFGSVALSPSVTLQMLAPGVSGALLTTVAGLVVAIPSVFGYNFLLTKTKELMTELENYASHLADRIEIETS